MLVDFFPAKKGCLKRRSQAREGLRCRSQEGVSSGFPSGGLGGGLKGRSQGKVSGGGIRGRSLLEVSFGGLRGRSQGEVSGGGLRGRTLITSQGEVSVHTWFHAKASF